MNELIEQFASENGHGGLLCHLRGRGAVRVRLSDGVLLDDGGAAVKVEGEVRPAPGGAGVVWSGGYLTCGGLPSAAESAAHLAPACGRRDLVLLLERRVNGFTDQVDVRLVELQALEDPEGNPVEGVYCVRGEGVSPMTVPHQADFDRLDGHMAVWVTSIRDPYRWWAKLVIPNER